MRAAFLSPVHRRHIATLRSSPAAIDEEGLRIGGQYVMFFAEAKLMRQHALRLVAGVAKPEVLEVGLGLGVFAAQLASMSVGSYTAIEPHEDLAHLAERRVLHELGKATVITEPWQVTNLPADAYDAIMYDTWPPDGHADSDFAAFVEHVAVPCLRPGGRFSFFHSGSAINDSRRQVLDRHFAGWTAHPYTMPAEQTPVHWTKPTRDFLIPIAVKGGK
ncbi:class I SAM-dependent methyltransferase [Phytohabitans sp. ZYX-F-186]|uniref:Class I SAM-dependent methyltransferase n=1 Tax=Phytohabitans maris TaxID=3071409 RepID=A0ABU0Z8W5_9ACTN|nr:class I SAM-dependent methyltransferase [Phytohabitans sp. ZYX-F-186]MDQ7903498.1 class I SAM-dependent methyltransferase [Phytohabitans sp. ZYX-F-186]